MSEEFHTISPGDLIYTWRKGEDPHLAMLDEAHIVIALSESAAHTFCYYTRRYPALRGICNTISLYQFNPRIRKHLIARHPNLFHTVEYRLQ